MTSIDTDDLWRRKVEGDRAARNELILLYRPMARRIAASVWRGTPSEVELEELVSYAYIGLMRAVDNFDPEKGAAFETYAPVCVRGGILDEIRTLDWAPRSVRRRQRDIDKAVAELEVANGEAPSIPEIAEKMGLEIDEVSTALRSTDRARIKSIDELASYSKGEDSEGEEKEWQPVSESDPDPAGYSVASAVQERVADSIRNATPQEQLVIALYYFERLTFRDVGAIMGIPESKASQIHSQVIMAIKDAMHDAVAMRTVCPICKTQLLPEDFDDETNTYECPDCETEIPV